MNYYKEKMLMQEQRNELVKQYICLLILKKRKVLKWRRC